MKRSSSSVFALVNVFFEDQASVSKERQTFFSKYSFPPTRMFWFLRSPHHSDITVLFDGIYPSDYNGRLTHLKKRQLHEIAIGSIPISYKNCTRKVIIIDVAQNVAGLGSEAVAFCKISEEGYLNKKIKNKSRFDEKEGHATKNNSNSPSRHELYFSNKFGLLFLMELSSVSASRVLGLSRTIDYFLSECEMDLYASLIEYSHCSLTADGVGINSDFENKVKKIVYQFYDNVDEISRSPFLVVQNSGSPFQSDFASLLFVTLLEECFYTIENKDTNYCLSSVLTALFDSLNAVKHVDAVGLAALHSLQKCRWILKGGNSSLVNVLVMIICLYWSHVASYICNGQLYSHFLGTGLVSIGPKYQPFLDVQGLSSPKEMKLPRYPFHNFDQMEQGLYILDSGKWILTKSVMEFSSPNALSTVNDTVYSDPVVVYLLERLVCCSQLGVSKSFCTEYLISHAIIHSLKKSLSRKFVQSSSSTHLKKALGLDV